jgi:hypothetical protein
MNKEKNILPLLLREKEALSSDEIILIDDFYKKVGRDGMIDYLKGAKPNKAFASLLFRELDIDSEFWGEVHLAYVNRNEQVLGLLDSIFRSFHAMGGVTLSVQENFCSVLSSNISIGCFASGDVDLHIEKEETEILKAALENNGFIDTLRTDKQIKPNSAYTEYFNASALDGKGFCMNLMHTPISRDDFMLHQVKYEKRLAGERENLEFYKDTDICIFNPTAALYICSLHIACAHYYSAMPGLPLYCDVDRIIRHRHVNWERLIKWSNEDQAGLRIALVLDLSHYFLNTEIPISLDRFTDINTSCYKQLRKRVVNEQGFSLTDSTGRLFRVYAELASDNLSLLNTIFRRIRNRI